MLGAEVQWDGSPWEAFHGRLKTAQGVFWSKIDILARTRTQDPESRSLDQIYTPAGVTRGKGVPPKCDDHTIRQEMGDNDDEEICESTADGGRWTESGEYEKLEPKGDKVYRKRVSKNSSTTAPREAPEGGLQGGLEAEGGEKVGAGRAKTVQRQTMVGSHQGGATVEKTAWVYQAQEARTDDGMGGPAGTYDWYRLARQEKWRYYTARVDGDLRNGY